MQLTVERRMSHVLPDELNLPDARLHSREKAQTAIPTPTHKCAGNDAILPSSERGRPFQLFHFRPSARFATPFDLILFLTTFPRQRWLEAYGMHP